MQFYPELEILRDKRIRWYHGKGNIGSENSSFETTITMSRYIDDMHRRTTFDCFGVLLSLMVHD